MIVRDAGTTYELITQPEHAQLARQIMDGCEPLRGHRRRDSILLAIGEHDNGWKEEDAAMTVDASTGALHDFIHAPLAVRHRVWPRGIARLHHDRWAAALVAQHALVAYDRFRKEPEWTSFFDVITRMRDDLLTGSDATLETLQDDYRFVRVADLISLTFCLGWTGSQSHADFTVGSDDGHTVTVAPGLFGGSTKPIAINARVIPKRRYTDATELQRTIVDAGTTTVRGAVVG